MMDFQDVLLYSAAAGLTLASFLKDRKRTSKALLKAWRSFEGILPQFVGIIMLIGIVLGILNPQTISRLIGGSSGWLGVLLSSLVGAITLIPGFIAFPTVAMLLKGGAGYMQMGAFVSSLMMVGIVTLPLEIKHFGRKAAFARNALAFIFSFAVAIVIGRVMDSR